MSVQELPSSDSSYPYYYTCHLAPQQQSSLLSLSSIRTRRGSSVQSELTNNNNNNNSSSCTGLLLTTGISTTTKRYHTNHEQQFDEEIRFDDNNDEFCNPTRNEKELVMVVEENEADDVEICHNNYCLFPPYSLQQQQQQSSAPAAIILQQKHQLAVKVPFKMAYQLSNLIAQQQQEHDGGKNQNEVEQRQPNDEQSKQQHEEQEQDEDHKRERYYNHQPQQYQQQRLGECHYFNHHNNNYKQGLLELCSTLDSIIVPNEDSRTICTAASSIIAPAPPEEDSSTICTNDASTTTIMIPMLVSNDTATSTLKGTKNIQAEQQQQQQQEEDDMKLQDYNKTNNRTLVQEAIEEKIRIIEKITKLTSTDIIRNEQDRYGDGDQSPNIIEPQQQYIFQELFYTGGDFTILLQSIPWENLLYNNRRSSNNSTRNTDNNNTNNSTNNCTTNYYNNNKTKKLTTKKQHNVPLELGGLSEFAIHCIAGHYNEVREILERNSVKRGYLMDTITKIVEKRETTLRLSPLMMIIAANTRLADDNKNKNKNKKIIANNNNVNSSCSNRCTNRMVSSSSSSTKICIPSCLLPSTTTAATTTDTTGIMMYYNSSTTNKGYDEDNYNYNIDTEELSEWDMNQLRVIEILLEYGARPDARDVSGKTVVHYGAGVDATVMSLRAVDMCCQAYKSSYLFHKEIELCNLHIQSTINDNTDTPNNTKVPTLTTTTTTTTQMTTKKVPLVSKLLGSKGCNNTSEDPLSLQGKRGIAQGYIVRTGCRIVYVFGEKHELRTLKPFQMKLVQQQQQQQPASPTSKNSTSTNGTTMMIQINDGTTTMNNNNLCDIPDRMGRVPLIEIYDTDRIDVGEFLLIQQNASIYVGTGWNLSTSGCPKGASITTSKSKLNNTEGNATVLSSTCTTKAPNELASSTKPLDNKNGACATTEAIHLYETTTDENTLLYHVLQIINNTSMSACTNNNNIVRGITSPSPIISSTGATRTVLSVAQLIYTLAIQHIKNGQRMVQNQCSQCRTPGTTSRPLRVCEQCKSVRFCSSECQIIHWKNGHIHECKWLAQEHDMFIVVTKDCILDPATVLPTVHRILSKTNNARNNKKRVGTNRSVFQKPYGIEYGAKFTVKVQHIQDMLGNDILWIHTKDRDCEFFLYVDTNNPPVSKNSTTTKSPVPLYKTTSTTSGITNNHCDRSKKYYGPSTDNVLLFEKIQTCQQHEQQNKSTGLLTTTKSFINKNNNSSMTSIISKATSSNLTGVTKTTSKSSAKIMYITAVFEDEHFCKLYVNQTKIKTW